MDQLTETQEYLLRETYKLMYSLDEEAGECPNCSRQGEHEEPCGLCQGTEQMLLDTDNVWLIRRLRNELEDYLIDQAKVEQ